MNKQKGFTIIELIVVIAIIAVLAAIVLVNVTGYINKGRDAAIKGNYAGMLTNAAAYFDANPAKNGSDYVGTTAFTSAETQITNAKGTPVHYGATTTQDWCACSPEVVTTGTSFCVDNTGVKSEKTSDCAAACTTPADGKCH
jgi:prepilin-type N-terminal cleavage/methylation domain-containing protein